MYFVNYNHFIRVYKIHLAYYSKLNIYVQVSYKEQFYMLRPLFWTSTHFLTTLTSNPPRFLAPFGLLPCLPQLQRPIRHAFLLLLDLCLLPRSFNVQSTTLSCSFWTSACFPAASTSNPTRIQATLASPQPQAPHNAKKQHQHISASIALYLLILF